MAHEKLLDILMRAFPIWVSMTLFCYLRHLFERVTQNGPFVDLLETQTKAAYLAHFLSTRERANAYEVAQRLVCDGNATQGLCRMLPFASTNCRQTVNAHFGTHFADARSAAAVFIRSP